MKRSAKDRKLIAEIITSPKQYRKMLREAQGVFWSRLGVSQSGGSRYESGRGMPEPTAILATLYALGYVSEDDLREVRELLAPFYGTNTPEQEVPKIVRPQLRPSAAQRAAMRKPPIPR